MKRIRTIVGLLTSVSLYSGSLTVYYLLSSWVLAASEDTSGDRATIVFFGAIWMVATALILELHDDTPLRRDLADAIFDLLNDGDHYSR